MSKYKIAKATYISPYGRIRSYEGHWDGEFKMIYEARTCSGYAIIFKKMGQAKYFLEKASKHDMEFLEKKNRLFKPYDKKFRDIIAEAEKK